MLNFKRSRRGGGWEYICPRAGKVESWKPIILKARIQDERGKLCRRKEAFSSPVPPPPPRASKWSGDCVANLNYSIIAARDVKIRTVSRIYAIRGADRVKNMHTRKAAFSLSNALCQRREVKLTNSFERERLNAYRMLSITRHASRLSRTYVTRSERPINFSIVLLNNRVRCLSPENYLIENKI